jgi:CMP-N-acetylneuraminic acid synthetase
MIKAVAFIPARSGSKRIPHKNIRYIGGHPLLAYSIRAALDSGVFDQVILATDSQDYADIGIYYGAKVPFMRESDISSDQSPDIEWVEFALNQLIESGSTFDIFSILRPTSPFRKAETIRRAYEQFLHMNNVDSLRAVEKCEQHPGKMWVVRGDYMHPLMPLTPPGQPWHSSQYAALPEVFIQNASLEIAWTRVVFQYRTISGQIITPFLTRGDEGLDVNQEFDWWKAERMLASGQANLPPISLKPYSNN